VDTPTTHRERGAITAMFVVLAMFFFGIISILAEGGRKLGNLGLAEDLAAEAARAAAATLDLDEIANGVAVIDQVDDRAREQAQAVVDATPNASIVFFGADDESVTIAVRVDGTSFIPGFDVGATGQHRALALDPFGGP